MSERSASNGLLVASATYALIAVFDVDADRTNVFWLDSAQTAAFDHGWPAHPSRCCRALRRVSQATLRRHNNLASAQQCRIASKGISVCKSNRGVCKWKEEGGHMRVSMLTLPGASAFSTHILVR